MSLVSFDRLPPSSRLWIYGCSRTLTPEEIQPVRHATDQFIAGWTAHRNELDAGWKLEHNRFFLIGVDQKKMSASGCSIDALVRFMKEIEEQLQCDIVSTAAMVFYRTGTGAIACSSRSGFKKLLQEGKVVPETVVFNNTLVSVADLVAEKWEVPMRESWHQRAFGTLV